MSADENEEEKEIIKFTYDESMVSEDTSQPTISFDTSDWENYLHLTPDADLVGVQMKQDTKTYYQGASLKITASGSAPDKPFSYGESLRDADNNLVHPDYDENTPYVNPGIELRAEDFGLSCFSGCTISFYYRIGTDVKGKLMGDAVYVYPVDEEYAHLASTPVTLTYNVIDNDNVSQYRSIACPAAAESNATRFVFEVPVLSNLSSDAFYLDNITIRLPKGEDGKQLVIKNIDGYNANAKPQETIEGLEIKKEGNTVSIAEGDKAKEGGTSVVLIVVIVVIFLLVAGVVAFVVIRHKNKFY